MDSGIVGPAMCSCVRVRMCVCAQNKSRWYIYEDVVEAARRSAVEEGKEKMMKKKKKYYSDPPQFPLFSYSTAMLTLLQAHSWLVLQPHHPPSASSTHAIQRAVDNQW